MQAVIGTIGALPLAGVLGCVGLALWVSATLHRQRAGSKSLFIGVGCLCGLLAVGVLIV